MLTWTDLQAMEALRTARLPDEWYQDEVVWPFKLEHWPYLVQVRPQSGLYRVIKPSEVAETGWASLSGNPGSWLGEAADSSQADATPAGLQSGPSAGAPHR